MTPLSALRELIQVYIGLMEKGRERIIDLGGTCDPVDVMVKGDPALRKARQALASVDAERLGSDGNEVRGDGGCLYCNADQGEHCRPDCTKSAVIAECAREAEYEDANMAVTLSERAHCGREGEVWKLIEGLESMKKVASGGLFDHWEQPPQEAISAIIAALRTLPITADAGDERKRAYHFTRYRLVRGSRIEMAEDVLVHAATMLEAESKARGLLTDKTDELVFTGNQRCACECPICAIPSPPPESQDITPERILTSDEIWEIAKQEARAKRCPAWPIERMISGAIAVLNSHGLKVVSQ